MALRSFTYSQITLGASLVLAGAAVVLVQVIERYQINPFIPWVKWVLYGVIWTSFGLAFAVCLFHKPDTDERPEYLRNQKVAPRTRSRKF
ncbi:MAG TPA: hypothetical protein VEC17_03185 [Candidatus Binatia bacterium]|nr:hypothetical protein [Candidatus Binatia bacterium]